MTNLNRFQNNNTKASHLTGFAGDNTVFINGKQKTRLLVRSDKENIPLRLDDIAFAYTENKMVVIVDCLSRKYMYDKTLTQLEEELCTHQFFRASRQYIINVNVIKSFRVDEKSKIRVNINVPHLEQVVIVSQENASIFKRWISEG